jgi:hypothetical protein
LSTSPQLSNYHGGEEFALKTDQVKKLREEGVNINLYYLLTLINNNGCNQLPKENVDRIITCNIKYAIEIFNPNILAFHNGITISHNNQEFICAINTIKKCHSEMTCLIENLDRPEENYVFAKKTNFLEWCKLNFEEEHILYDIIWKPTT